MKIGLIDVDTTHPQNWIPIERELGYEVAAMWDGGSVHPKEYVENFSKEHDVPLVASIDEMVEKVDCAIVHGCDWDTHIEKAKPFIDAGKAVLIDKPIAGKLADLNQIRVWAKSGARITGGSSLRFCYEARDWLARPLEERGTPHTVICGCGVDEFNYGCHAYSLLGGLMGSGVRAVKQLSEGVQRRIQITWEDGRVGFLVIGKVATWLPFYATIATERSVHQFIPDAANLYRALLESVLPYLAGEADEPLVDIDTLLEPELCALAAKQSWMNDNAEVLLSELSESGECYDGAAFADFYRRNKYPSS